MYPVTWCRRHLPWQLRIRCVFNSTLVSVGIYVPGFPTLTQHEWIQDTT